ncbi:hypothetical protein D8M31_00540 [Corynebacterium genitalium]|nr:hypothetical protein D8M31_00540 [Corynebacterium genitalium]
MKRYAAALLPLALLPLAACSNESSETVVVTSTQFVDEEADEAQDAAPEAEPEAATEAAPAGETEYVEQRTRERATKPARPTASADGRALPTGSYSFQPIKGDYIHWFLSFNASDLGGRLKIGQMEVPFRIDPEDRYGYVDGYWNEEMNGDALFELGEASKEFADIRIATDSDKWIRFTRR